MPTELPQRTDPPANGPAHDARANAVQQRAGDGSSFRIATVAGIQIRVHITFFLIFVFVFAGSRSGPNSGAEFRFGVLFILALFTCVVLHELGHALTALRYGVRTRDIVLWPIGGVATLEQTPEPRDEFWIALAGPAVNVVIAGLLYVLLKLTHTPLGDFEVAHRPTSFFGNLMWTNLFLAGFNMLPAFPMDGGRVLRSLLTRVTDPVRATFIAARVGQWVAILFALTGLFGSNIFLIIIGVFVYLGAGQEEAVFRARSLLSGHRVREAMIRDFRTLTNGNTLKEAADALLAGSQHDFPIVYGEDVVGVLPRNALLRGIASEGLDAYVAATMEREFLWARPDEPLEQLMTRFQEAGGGPILVMEGEGDDPGQLVGMITQENLLEFLTLTQISRRASVER